MKHNEVLKNLALKAKNRMIHKNGASDFEGSEGLNIKIIAGEDQQFLEKVRSLIDSSEDIINPLKMLMDEDIMLTMDARGRERYLLETIEKYHKALKHIEKERSSIISA